MTIQYDSSITPKQNEIKTIDAHKITNKFKQTLNNWKLIETMVWNQKDVLLKELIQSGITINAAA